MEGTGLPPWLSGKGPTCQCRRCGFDPWLRKIPWRRKWQPTPVILPGKSHGQRSRTGYSPWGHIESDTAERLTTITNSLLGRSAGEGMDYPLQYSWASLLAQLVKNPANAGDARDAGLIPGSGRSPGGESVHPHRYSCLGNPKDRGAWQATVHRVAKSQT